MSALIVIIYCAGLAGFLMAVIVIAEIHPPATAPGDVWAWAAVAVLALVWPISALAVPTLRHLYLYGGIRTRRVLRLVRRWQVATTAGFEPATMQATMKPSA